MQSWQVKLLVWIPLLKMWKTCWWRLHPGAGGYLDSTDTQLSSFRQQHFSWLSYTEKRFMVVMVTKKRFAFSNQTDAVDSSVDLLQILLFKREWTIFFSYPSSYIRDSGSNKNWTLRLPELHFSACDQATNARFESYMGTWQRGGFFSLWATTKGSHLCFRQGRGRHGAPVPLGSFVFFVGVVFVLIQSVVFVG